MPEKNSYIQLQIISTTIFIAKQIFIYPIFMISKQKYPIQITQFFHGDTLSTKKYSRCVVYFQKEHKYLQKTICVTDDEKLLFLRNLLLECHRLKQIGLTTSNGYLIITRPFMNIADYLETIKKADCLVIVLERLIMKLMQAPNRRFYTYDNIFIQQDQQILLNLTSFAGVLPLAYKEDFPVEEFKQIYELLTVELFQNRQSSKFTIPWQTKLRSIGMMILYALFGKKISLLPKDYINRKIITRKQAIVLVGQLQQQMRLLFSKDNFRNIIFVAQQRDGLSYGRYLQEVFINNCMNMSWQKAIQYLSPKYKQIRINSSIISTDLQQGSSHISFQMLIRKEFDLYYNSLSNKSKLQQLGITKQLYLYLKLQMSSFRMSLQQFIQSENYQNTKQSFNFLSEIINENEELRKLNDKKQCFEIKMNQRQTLQTKETEKKAISKKFCRAETISFGSKSDNIKQKQNIKAVKQIRIASPQIQQNLQGFNDDNEGNSHLSDCKPANKFPFELLQQMGKHLLAVPLEYNGGKIKGINNKMKMINKYLKL